MARGGPRANSGGARPGAGRPRKERTQIEQAPAATVRTPLEYLLAVMNDPTADPLRRDAAARSAAPYLHERKGVPARPGKKDEAEQLALVADDGTSWAGLLQ